MLALAQQSNILEFPAVAPQGKSNEWYTPARYIEAAREVMQGIDLDPASCELANRTVKAKRYYTQAENGLVQPWHGRVWLNPPYKLDKSQPPEKRSSIAKWLDKLMREYQEEHVEQAIMLNTAQTYTHWFNRLWTYPICFVDHKLWFYAPYHKPVLKKGWHSPGPNKNTHIFGTIFVYLGPNEQKFIDIFSQFGTIAKRVSQPRRTIATPSLWEVAQ